MQKISEALSTFVSGSDWNDVPAIVKHEAKRALLNYFAVAFAGAGDPTVEKLSKTLAPFAANSQASVIGLPDRTDMLNAAAINAASSNVFDFDDTHERTVIHPTGPVAAALLAHAQSNSTQTIANQTFATRTHLAHAKPTTGAAFLHALILGIDIECRIGNALSPGHYARGWHITSTCGVLGAAMAMGKVSGLSAQQLTWALGSAANQACGQIEALGTMAKSTSVANAARNGLLSALLAAADFSGPDQPLEGPRGFLRVMGDTVDWAPITEALGERWELMGNSYKPYPCGVVLNPVIEACLQVARTGVGTGVGTGELNGLIPEDITRIELTGHPLLRQRTDRPDVHSGRASQVSAQHAVAVSLLRGRAGLAEFSDEAVQDPRIQALGQTVCFNDDPSFAIDSATITLQFRSRADLQVHVEHARGSIGRPLSDADLEEKFMILSAAKLSPARAAALMQSIWTVEQLPDVAQLMEQAHQAIL
jgi:2-methylcitrate dehydratase PrpD